MTTLTSTFALFVGGRLIVSGDAAATATNILGHEALFRSGTAAILISTACYVAVTLLIYELLKPVNRTVSLLAAFFSLVGCAVGAISCIFDLAPFVLLGGARYLSVFTVEQLQALALMFLKVRGQANDIGLVFFGLHCLSVGYLIFRSTFLPRILGALMVFAGLGWLTFLSPPLAKSLSPYSMLPGGLGELSLTLWLLVIGVNVQRWKEQSSAAREWRSSAHSQPLITAICTAALLFTSAALAETSPSVAPLMKAIVYHEYGSPDVLRLEEIEKPVPNDDQVLVKVRAASVNPLDWHYIRGSPYFMRMVAAGLLKPNETRLGVDYAGTVESVGKNVTEFKPGDEVFGGRTGAFAEYVTVRAERAVVLKPANLTFEQAASVPIAAITALQGLRDKGKIQPGQKVLINGASGGVGTFAVQIAKSFGADVTGVCSTRNVEMVRSIGADQVIDYTKEDVTKRGERYDLILDNVGNHSLLEWNRVLKPKGIFVTIGGGGPNDGRWIGSFLVRPIKARMLSPFVSQEFDMLLAELNKKDLTILSDLMQAGKVKPVIDRGYSLSEVPEAIRYLEKGHARGKVVITMDQNNKTLPVNANLAASLGDTIGADLIAFGLIGILIGVSIVPIVVALVLNRRFQQRNPGKRPYRWGLYFSILSFLGGMGLGIMLESGVSAVIVCGVIYAVLAWSFAQRRHWAWVALTILSFNPVAWIINFIYLRKRWAEDSVATQPI